MAKVWTYQIVLQKLIASWTNRIVMPLRRCIIRRPLDKSDRIAIETCHVVHCAAVSSSDIFETAGIILRTKKDWHLQERCNTPDSAIETAVPKISDDDTAAQRTT